MIATAVAADHDDPVDHLLAAIEAIGRRMVVADDPAAALDPFDIDLVRDVAGDPHQEDAEHADGEREAQIVVRVLRPLRPGGERALADQRHQQRLAEGDVQPGHRQDDEAGRRHPVDEALERVEAHDAAARIAALELHLAAHEIERDQERQHAEDGDRADPAQRHLVELAPVAARRAGSALPDFWSGMLTRPLIVPPLCSALSSCCSFTELAVGLTERRCCCAPPEVAMATSKRDGQRADDETSLRETASPCRNLLTHVPVLRHRRDVVRRATGVDYVAIVSRYAVCQPQAPEP